MVASPFPWKRPFFRFMGFRGKIFTRSRFASLFLSIIGEFPQWILISISGAATRGKCPILSCAIHCAPTARNATCGVGSFSSETRKKRIALGGCADALLSDASERLGAAGHGSLAGLWLPSIVTVAAHEPYPAGVDAATFSARLTRFE